MKHLDRREMGTIEGRGGTACGIGVGALIGASALYGVLGFAMVVNKTALLCGLEPWI